MINVTKRAEAHHAEIQRLIGEMDVSQSYENLQKLVHVSIQMLMQSLEKNYSPKDDELVATVISHAIDNMKVIAERHPESAEDIYETAKIFAAGCSFSAYYVNGFKAGLQFKTMRPLRRQDSEKKLVIKRAKVIAAELWQADTEQEFRLKEMADQVEDILKREGVEEKNLPKTRIKEWIKPIAPDYARLGGRPAKPRNRNG